MADKIPLKAGATGVEQFASGDTIPASMIGVTPIAEVPSGTINGSNVTFTLSETPVSGAAVMIALDGGVSTNGTDFTVSGTTVTFAVAPATGTEMFAMYNSISGAPSVGGDFSSNTSSSADGEVVLFSGTGGKTGKRATGSGFAKLASGVLSAQSATSATAELDVVVGDSGSGGTKGLVPAPASGDAAAGKYLKADGTWTAPPSATPSVISPSSITSDQDNYAPSGFSTATVLLLSGDSSFRAITGFDATGATSGDVKSGWNVGSYPLYLPSEHPDSSASNRIAGDRDHVVLPNRWFCLVRDGSASRWRLITQEVMDYRILLHKWSMGSTTAGDYGQIAFLAISSGTVNNSTSPGTANPLAIGLSTSTTTTGGGSAYLSKGGATFFFGDGHITSDYFIRINGLSDATNTFTIEMSLSGSPNGTTLAANNTCGVRYSHGLNSGKFEAYNKNNSGTESTADTGVTVAANTMHYIRIEVDKARAESRFYIDGAFVCRITGSMPNAVSAGSRAMVLKSAGTSARVLSVSTMSTRIIY